MEIARCLVRALDIWAVMTQNSADSDIDGSGTQSACVFAFFHSGGEKSGERRLRLRRGEAAQPLLY